MRPLKPGGRAEPSLTRSEQAAPNYYADEPVLRRSDRPAPSYPPIALREDELREAGRAFARALPPSEPALTRAEPQPAGGNARRLFSTAAPVLAHPEDEAQDPGAEAAPRKRIGIPLRWLETRSETRARKALEQQEAEDLARLEAFAPAADPAPLRFGAEPPLSAPRSALSQAPQGRGAAPARPAVPYGDVPQPAPTARLAAQSHASAMAWVGRGEEIGEPVAAARIEAPSLQPYRPGRAEPQSGRADEAWSPLLPGHAPLRSEPTMFRSTEPARALPVFGTASAQAVAAARYWPNEPAPLAPANSGTAPVEEADDEDDVPFRPWLSAGSGAQSYQVAVPGSSGSGIVLARPEQAARGAKTAVGPWDADAAAEPDRSDEPGWDRFYAEPEGGAATYGGAQSYAAFYDDVQNGDDAASFESPMPPRVEPARAAAFAAVEAVPEAPMIEARAPRRDNSRRDPAPSRTAYRLQRMWLTPLYRALLRKGLPAFVVVFAFGIALKDEGRRDALVAWASDLRATITERPEFMLSELKIEGTSPETAEALRAVLDVQFPVSSFDLELTALQEKATQVSAVSSAALHVRSGGVLEVVVEERKPVVVWRSETGIGTLDQTGHQVATLQNRLERPDLPLIVGLGAETSVPEALRLYQAAGPIRDRVRGLIRVGERRWDLIVDPAIRVMLPAKDPVPALEQVVALHEAQVLLDRDITAVDLRNPARATVRMGDPAAETWRLNLAAQRGK